MARINYKTAHTLAELLIAIALFSILTISAFGALLLARQVQVSGITGENFQRDANLIIGKIIKVRWPEPTGVFRLAEAVSYRINGISDLSFTGIDGNVRRYYLDPGGTSILYDRPGWVGAVTDTIYTAPPGAALGLRFWAPTGSTFANIVVGIDVAISQSINNRNISGSATTLVNIRNHNV